MKGFTLIELLVTVAIIGILSAQSIAIYEEFKTHAYNLHALSYLRTAVTEAKATEEYSANWGTYYAMNSTNIAYFTSPYLENTALTVDVEIYMNATFNDDGSIPGIGVYHIKGSLTHCFSDANQFYTVNGLAGSC